MLTVARPPTASVMADPRRVLLPIMAVVAMAFLIIGLVLSVLPLHVHLGLGLRTFVVGLVAGSQSLRQFSLALLRAVLLITTAQSVPC